MRIERITSPQRQENDPPFASVRPRNLRDFIGQTSIKEKLEIYIAAAKERGEPLDHVLLHGPPGLGKTTLAHIITAQLGVEIKTSSGPALERPGDLAAILTNLRPGDVFFIDEVHRLRRNVEEILYPALEDFKIDVILGEGPNAQSLRIDLPPFTLISATTRTGLLSSPLRNRFEVIFYLDFYQPAELEAILLQAGRTLGIEVTPEGARELAARARGTPRIAIRLLKRARDYAQIKGNGVVDHVAAQKSLRMLEIDEQGLDNLDRQILTTIITKFNCGPVGLETIAAALSEEKETISEVYEPYLLKQGFLQRTLQGRIATDHAVRHLGLR
ncbi:Holliday junction branch migration DNA helicase RuvB [Candidatus Acetothermia bacterium]|jgi:Holliday junction DNA helicase RuvB|nr:Holliday junction branch migration DNA helicase RuvB [Candidatus Acetothermia bacterium]MCI2426862.1 Holliday junction branch migration DNA helicase RuvB [Candidatus Acetothermia bacterium]MCI2427545.1 Holliday junction branch migration DNA helicase RuvB [Candidatus Acetothermia bacterium]MCI2428114.1 Holliday junction branch migration DNA helicase RuvB [Candidatus Acetothermia bacterium]